MVTRVLMVHRVLICFLRALGVDRVICQETKEWTAIHDRKNALASLANLEMKTLQTRNITQP